MRSWFDGLRLFPGSRWGCQVSTTDACGWNLKGYVRALDLAGFRQFGPVHNTRSIAGLAEPFDAYYAEENPTNQIQVYRLAIAMERTASDVPDPREAEGESRLLSTLAKDPSVEVREWRIWTARGEDAGVSADAGSTGKELYDRLLGGGEPVLPLGRLPAATLATGGESANLDDDAWLSLSWAHLLWGKRGAASERLAGLGGTFAGDTVDEIRAFVMLARSKLGDSARPPLLPNAWKRFSWQWHAALRASWMLNEVWAASDPPALPAALAALDSFCRRAHDAAVSLQVSVRDKAN